jgi:CRISPR-associated endonuclease/helicase Cas3
LFALLRRCNPDHPALLGPWRELLSRIHGDGAMPAATPSAHAETPTPLEAEVLALSADDFDLLLYLVCSHHGKVRMSWHASPADQAAHDDAPRIRGVRAGDILPATAVADTSGKPQLLPELELVLAPAAAGLNVHTGRGWTERVIGLLQRHGPFTLAWLEALLRAADQRATRDTSLVDTSLQPDNSTYGLEGIDSPLARAAGGGEAPPPVAGHPAQRGEQLRVRGRAGGPGHAGSRTRPPAHATRYVETRLGTLSYLELAPHLARMASAIESEIESGQFDADALDEQLVLSLDRLLCESLTPQLAGWRRNAVVVGTHTPPDAHLVPMLMHEYCLDLQARLDTAMQGEGLEDRLLESLAFAEGRLLSIHPFADFNGRVTRLFLRLLLRRLDLPGGGLTPEGDQLEAYLEALRAGDRRNWLPLMDVWRQRFVRESSR